MMTEPFETLRAPRIRRSGRGAAAASLAALLVLAGCAPADPAQAPTPTAGDPPAAEDPAPEETDAGEADEAAPATVEVGTAVVDGTTYSITELRNCEPFEQEGIEVELELRGFGEADGERVQIDVYVQTIGGAPFNSVSWLGPEGVFGSQEGATVDLGADRVSGSATIVNSLTLEGELPIEFDLEVPDELIACR